MQLNRKDKYHKVVNEKFDFIQVNGEIILIVFF